MHFKHVVLASRHVGILLFSRYYQETLENLKPLLGSGGALAGHLFECYVHFLFEYGYGDPLICRSLDGLIYKRDLMHRTPGDGDELLLESSTMTLPLLFVVPESIANKFRKQQILTTTGQTPAMLPSVRQFVAGLPLGIDTSPIKKRRVM